MIDTHQHFWHYDATAHSWIVDEMASLRRDWLPDDLLPTLQANGVDGAITVQAVHQLAETEQLLEWAARHDFVAGVVGWIDLAGDGVRAQLDRMAPNPWLVGIRHVVQGGPAGLLDHAAFNRGVDALTEADLSYDLLVQEHQLPEAIRFADRHPDTRIVLDHLGRPRNELAELEPWRASIIALAERPHVMCKLSGGITESALDWTYPSLQPYFETVLEAFAPGRVMFGSNWPLTEAAGGYGKWVDAVRQFIAPLSADERQQVLDRTARAFYRLEARP